MNWNMIRGWLATLARLVIGVLWVWAGLAKLGSPRTFTQTVRAYDATPEWLSTAIGYGLPVLEVCLGVLLVLGVTVRLAAAVSALLFVVFLIGLIQAAARGIKLDCGCFGGGGLTLGPTHYTLDILQAAGLLVLAAYLVWWPVSRISIDEYLARHDYVEPPSAKRMRSDAGQRKYLAQVAAKQRSAQVRGRYVNSSFAIVVVLVAIIGIGVQANRAKLSGNPSTDNTSAKYGVVFGKVAAARVDIYEDFQCPQCRVFEQAVRTTLEADVRANRAQVHYYPVAFLDSSSNGKRYSSRAANAAVCAADFGVDAFVKYHDVLFGTDSSGAQVQPTPGDSRNNQKLIDYGQQAGFTPTQVTTFTGCVQAESYQTLVEAITNNASKRGVNATPTVKVNGKTLPHPDLASLKAAIAAADAKGPAPSPSVTPKPSPSPSGSAASSAASSGSPAPSPSAAAAPSGSPVQ